MEALKHLTYSLRDKYKKELPFPVFKLARDLDLEVYLTDDLKEYEGGTVRKDEKGVYSIFVNQIFSPPRQRLVIAHEIGHFLLHGSKQQEAVDLIKWIESGVMELEKKGKYNYYSLEAHKFAFDLLMPKNEFFKMWQKLKTLDEMARHFAVSREAVAVRANNILNG